MSENTPQPNLGINDWLEDELYQQYLHDRSTVDESWKKIFDSNGTHTAATRNGSRAVAAANAPAPAHQRTTGEELVPMRGPALRLAENMTASLTIPSATSQRMIPVKVIDENRQIVNNHRSLMHKSKVSYTHIIGWAIVRALETSPTLNHAYAQVNGESFRAVRKQVNLGIAVDLAGKDGVRALKVPNIKDAGSLDFERFLAVYDDIVARARDNKLQVQDFEGTTISLTNPGTVGTYGSVPRLMPGQGAIIATGAIDIGAAHRGTSESTRAELGLGKSMMLTCTYDHRVIQGAESGAFLGRLEDLLQGKDGFYDEIFEHLRVPHLPVRWQVDAPVSIPGIRLDNLDQMAKTGAVHQLINAYRVRGHLLADLDPLVPNFSSHPELEPSTYGLTIWDLDREFLTGTLTVDGDHRVAALREILETLRGTYAGKIGCEYMNIQIPEQKRWLQERMEPTRNRWPLDSSTKLRALNRLIEAEEFEHFLQSRFVGHKRFSIEGAESAVVILDELLDRAANTGVEEAVMGMSHRGRLNVLANIIGKSMSQVFSEFEGLDPFSAEGSGDVKYHLGASGVRTSTQGKEIEVSVASNPSHLEAVNPVVEGMTRPKQDRIGDVNRERVIPILVHGDAAFAGQGVVAETLNLSQLEGYSTGGTIHLVINNQIGFTTNPNQSRSTAYSTDIARVVQAPIFHVNGDAPQACIRVVQLAYDFRQNFKKDVVIDMVCYRRHGHNEADDPSYTQPILYRQIRQQPSVAVQYSERLVREKLLDASEVERMRKAVKDRLNKAFDEGRGNAVAHPERTREPGVSRPVSVVERSPEETGANRSTLERVINGVTTFPSFFHVHPKLKGFIEKRKEVLNGAPVDWATGEVLAYGSLVLEGTPVRLSGQDSARGTFSQRHLVYYDHETGHPHLPLRYLSKDQARFDVFDSSLSEYAVMGFEFGYSLADPSSLVLWEAQFGDFSNGAQIMIDQFVSSSEAKWAQRSGLVLLLPHGYEGQGPEHSSARMERYLQLCAEDNMQVVNCTTPAQYFHVLRRQMYGGADGRGLLKPLVIFTPKRMLRHPKAVSHIGDFAQGEFHKVLADESNANSSKVTRVVFCCGQLYYDLVAAREQKKAGNVAVVRVEQLYPFPASQLDATLSNYPAGTEIAWVQEEPRNMGAWRFVEENLPRPLRYIGRPASASPAAGSLKRHQEEQAEIIDEVFAAESRSTSRGDESNS
jgi:2-oxoglutarate decarboxylase